MFSHHISSDLSGRNGVCGISQLESESRGFNYLLRNQSNIYSAMNAVFEVMMSNESTNLVASEYSH